MVGILFFFGGGWGGGGGASVCMFGRRCGVYVREVGVHVCRGEGKRVCVCVEGCVVCM